MDLTKRYQDSNGNQCDILQMVSREPEWAANRLQEGEKAIEEVGLLKQGMWQMKDAEIARWKYSYENMRDFAIKSGLDITCYG